MTFVILLYCHQTEKGKNGKITSISRNGQDFQNLTEIPFDVIYKRLES